MKILNLKGKVETAFTRILEPYKTSTELRGFQWVYRFFDGTLKDRRLSFVCGTPQVALRDEDNTPNCWNVPITIELVTHRKFTTPADHDELVALVSEAIIDGADTCAALNTAMTGEGFDALVWIFGDGPEEENDGTIRKARITGVLMMRPVDPA